MEYEEQQYVFQGTHRTNRASRASKGESYRLHGANHNGVKVYDGGNFTSLKSPEVPDITFISDNNSEVSVSPGGTRKKAPFTFYQTVNATPKLIVKNDDDEFTRKLGKRNENLYNTGKILSPVERSPVSISQTSPISNNSRKSSPRNYEDDHGDYNRFYKPKNRQCNNTSEDSEVIRLLKMQIEEQKKLIDVFMEREKKRETPMRSEKREGVKANFKIPKEEENTPDKTKKSKILDYESMDDEEIKKYEAKFRGLFNTLKEKYPRWDIEVPKIGEISLRTVHEIYEEIIDTIIIYQNAMKYKVFLVIAFAGVEYYFYKVKKIRAFKNFTKVQIKSLPKYHVYLLNFSKSLHERGDEEWPSWLNFVSNIITSLLSFISIQGAANAMGWSAPESILHEADKFVSPDHGPAKLKHDGISEVPPVPTGLQDPNVIIDRGLRLYETVEDLNNMSEAEPVPVNAKPVNVGKYDDVFE